jgi:SAM-dependent methyltransferase
MKLVSYIYQERRRTLSLNKWTEKQPDEESEALCPVCGSPQSKAFFEMLDVPVFCNRLWSNRDSAINCPKGHISLTYCPACSYIMNRAFEPHRVEYTQAYDNSLHFSPFYQKYARSLAKSLIERYQLYQKDIVTIGCGKGEFLLLLCELGNNRGVGFDPSYVKEESHAAVGDRVKFIQDYYSQRYADLPADLIVCRQVLEHVWNPMDLLKTLRSTVGKRVGTNIFFEVPNAIHTFCILSVWDIIYEHCSYFTPISLSLAFSSSGFRVCEVTEEFGSQYLCVYALPDNQRARGHQDYRRLGDMSQIERDIVSFSANYQSIVEMFRRKLQELESKGKRVVLWGAGSKGVTFLNTFQHCGQIKFAVDINPRKQGLYVPGTGQKIVPPEFLQDYQPDAILVMNPVYMAEIQKLAKKLKLKAKFMDASGAGYMDDFKCPQA